MAEKQCNSSSCTKESCEGCPSKNKPTSFQVASNEYTKVKHVIGVVSGKGGVGKSMVTASLANMMAEKGYRVGILDADITGPSIPKCMDCTDRLRRTIMVFIRRWQKMISKLCLSIC